MKDLNIKNFVMILTLMVACANQTSCIPPIVEPPLPPEPEFSLVGTTWSYTDRFEEDEISYTIDYTISFPSPIKAKLSMNIAIKEGTQTTNQRENIGYTYTYDNDLIIMNSMVTGYANLKGIITSETEMEVTNASSGEKIGTFYRN